MPQSGYCTSVTCNVGVALTDHLVLYLRNNPVVELMISVAAIWKIKSDYINSKVITYIYIYNIIWYLVWTTVRC